MAAGDLLSDVSIDWRRRRSSYGGSDRSDPSFLRPQINRYNSLSRSRDFGTLDNLAAVVSGTIGGGAGTQTLYFQVRLAGAADLRIVKISGNPREDQYISVGILGPDHKPLPLDEDGFAIAASDVHGTESDESSAPLPAGTYWFTVSSSQWQPLPYGAALQVLRYRELNGAAGGTFAPALRLALVKLVGAAGGSFAASGSIPRSSRIRAISGNAGGSASATGALVIPSGTAICTAPVSGRIKVTWRIAGTATGSAGGSASLSVSSGGGYGY